MAWQVFKRLSSAGAQIATSTTAVYTAPASKNVEICSISLHNTGVITEDVVIYADGTTSAHIIDRIALEPNETYENAPKVPICLYDGAAISAKTTTASTVNIRITGREEV